MELAARPDVRHTPCDPGLVADVSAHLARPATVLGNCGSPYSLRN